MASWLRIEGEGVPGGSLRRQLVPGLTRIGGAGCEVELSTAGADQLHLWGAPARVRFVGVGARPNLGGQGFEERPLQPGDCVSWAGIQITFERDPERPVLEELAPEPAAAAKAAPSDPTGWKRVQAGIAAELGLADPGALRRWQEAVKAGNFDPDACAEELLEQPLEGPSLQRVTDRAGKLERDLIMAPLQRGTRGAGRKVRGAARTGAAYLLSQLFISLVFALLFAIVLLLVRLRWEWSVDAFIDSVLDLLPG